MACIINSQANKKPFKKIATCIGTLYLYELRVKDTIGIKRKLGKKLDELSSEEFFRFFLPFFAYLHKDLVSEVLERPDEYTLKNDEIQKLSKEELEEIAKSFIEKNSFLYKKFTSSNLTNEDSTQEMSLNEEIDQILLKKGNENYIDYVYRLMLANEKKEQAEMKKIFSSFSSGLSDNIIKTMNIGEALKDSLNLSNHFTNTANYFSSNSAFIQPLKKLNMPEFDFTKIHDQQRKERLAPFKDLSSKMDLMIETEKQTVSFMDDVYKTQLQIATELKTSSDAANETSKLNIKYTQFIIVLTVISTFITALTFAYPVWFDNNSEKVIKTNEDIQSSITETNKKLEKLTEVLIKQNEIQNEQIKILSDEIKKSKLQTSTESKGSK